MAPNITCYGVLSTLEQWLKGYRSEHLKLGIQQGLCFAIALLPTFIDAIFNSFDRGGSVVYTVIAVAVVLEPSTGEVLQKFLLRMLSAGISGGIGLLLLYIAVGDHKYDFTNYRSELGVAVVVGMTVAGFIFMTNRQRYWRQREYWDVALLMLPIVVVPAIRESDSMFYKGAAYRMLNVMFGIIIAAVVATLVFPVRARGLLKSSMARTLVKIGDLSVWLVGQVCMPPQPGPGNLIPGTSLTDTECLYADDGMRAKLAPLRATARDLGGEVAHMEKLLEAARTEYYLFSKPHRFPTQQYRNLLDSCQIVLGIMLSLLYSLESGDVSLDCCQRHVGDLSETGVRMSAAFTALSSLIEPPKLKKKKKQKLLLRKRKQEKAEAGGDGGDACQQQQDAAGRQPPAAAAAAATEGAAAAAAAAAAAQQPQKQQQVPVGLPAVVDLEMADDPFAEVEDGQEGMLELSPSQLIEAQQMARTLSLVMSRHNTRGSGGASGSRGRLALEPHHEEWQEESDAAARGTADDKAQPARGSESNGGSHGRHHGITRLRLFPRGKPSMGTSLNDAIACDIERRQWVLSKLRALTDAIIQLEGDAHQERQAGVVAAGVPAFMLIVHACTNLARQCCACFTALDAERGAQLHAYHRANRRKDLGNVMHPKGGGLLA